MSASPDSSSNSPNSLDDLQTEPERLTISEPDHHQRRWGHHSEDDKTEKPAVLEPNHPLLQRFQQTLRSHLLAQIERLSNEVNDLEASINDQEKAREALGLAVYDQQQSVCQQQKKLDETEKELNDLLKSREEQEIQFVDTKKKYEQQKQMFYEEDKKEKDLRRELENLALLEKQLEKWKVDMESELTVNERISDKTLQQRKVLTDEKKQLDMIIYKLMTEVWKSEAELKEMDTQLRVEEKKREELNLASLDANANLEAINSQQKGLVRSWNNVILNLKKRDRTYADAQEEVSKIHDQIQTIEAEIEAYKKSCDQEMMESVRLLTLKERATMELASIAQQRKQEEQKRASLETELAQIRLAMQKTENDLQTARAVVGAKETELRAIMKDIEEQANLKVKLEDQLMVLLDECTTNDKTGAYLTKLVREMKEKTRALEIQMVNTENLDAKLLVEIENQRAINLTNSEYILDLKRELHVREEGVNKFQNELKNYKTMAIQKQRVIDTLQPKLAELLLSQGIRKISPQDIKINNLEKQIEQADIKIKELENLWMTEQTHIVSLSQQRNEQLKEINLLRKQIMILHQKSLHLEDEIEKHRKREIEMSRNVDKLLKQLERMNTEIAKNRNLNEITDFETTTAHANYVFQLQETEADCIRIETEISNLEEEKDSLTQQLVEVNREGLNWERQGIMATEARKKIEQEKASSGEVGAMRNEIHRMHVRYGQLRRAQERLVADLEYCVSRRDAILTGSFAREKTSQNGINSTRMHYARKIIDLKAKIKQTLKNIEEYKKEFDIISQKEAEVLLQVQAFKQKLEDVQYNNKYFEGSIEEKEIHKHLNVDRMIRRQKRVKALNNLLNGTYRCRPKNIIEIEEMKQREMKSKLQTILQSLQNDFPQHQIKFKKLYNSFSS